jgi:hypothetical protein
MELNVAGGPRRPTRYARDMHMVAPMTKDLTITTGLYYLVDKTGVESATSRGFERSVGSKPPTNPKKTNVVTDATSWSRCTASLYRRFAEDSNSDLSSGVGNGEHNPFAE